MRVALVRLENTGEYQTKDKRYLVERLEGRNKYQLKKVYSGGNKFLVGEFATLREVRNYLEKVYRKWAGKNLIHFLMRLIPFVAGKLLAINVHLKIMKVVANGQKNILLKP